ncbi:MAG: type III secretion system chaperone [Pseudomonadota bacterium]
MRPFVQMRSLALLFAGCVWVATACAQSDAPDAESRPDPQQMSIDRIETIIGRVDENYERNQNNIIFTFADYEILLVSDPAADRMRVMIPVNPADALDEEELLRLMQANFDSALDARYAIANGMLWSTFIHRLSSLTEEDLLSGIGQTINTADTFGTSYSSGELVFGGGDSNELRRKELIEELKERGQKAI